jgi:hypothetical protein
MRVKGFYISPGNTKVRWPIVNTSAGTDCPSALWCPFSEANHKASGRKLCYAVKAERLYPNVLSSRRQNARMIADGTIHARAVAVAIDGHFKRNGSPYGRTCRINESGDLCAQNIQFVVTLIRELKALKINVYMYSKAPAEIMEHAMQAGAVVLQSERDFIAIPNKGLLPARAALCPGQCGPCRRCPQGRRTYILEH